MLSEIRNSPSIALAMIEVNILLAQPAFQAQTQASGAITIIETAPDAVAAYFDTEAQAIAWMEGAKVGIRMGKA